MTLQQLTYFLAAIEHGSFSAAADALHLAQPSLSEQVRRLEDELGSGCRSRVDVADTLRTVFSKACRRNELQCRIGFETQFPKLRRTLN